MNKSKKSPNIWKLKNKLLSNFVVKEEIKSEIRNYFELTETENIICQHVGYC